MPDQSSLLVSQLEALLFLQGEILPYKKIASLLSISEDEVRNICEEYKALLSDERRGLMLVCSGEGCQLATKPIHEECISSFLKEGIKEDLTPATRETLALIAYFGPIKRFDIDYIRGVNSTFTIRTLLVRGLIEKAGQEGHSYLYEVSADFLKQIGVSSQKDLPEYEKYQDLHSNLFKEDTPLSHES